MVARGARIPLFNHMSVVRHLLNGAIPAADDTLLLQVVDTSLCDGASATLGKFKVDGVHEPKLVVENLAEAALVLYHGGRTVSLARGVDCGCRMC